MVQDSYNLTVTATSVNYSCQSDRTTVEISVSAAGEYYLSLTQHFILAQYFFSFKLVIITCIYTVACHRSDLCSDASITIQAASASECCQKGGKTFYDSLRVGCITACRPIIGKCM